MPVFQPHREIVDPMLAKTPAKYLLMCLRCGIAPALKKDGSKIDWGQSVGEDLDEDLKRLMGNYITLTQGKKAHGLN